MHEYIYQFIYARALCSCYYVICYWRTIATRTFNFPPKWDTPLYFLYGKLYIIVLGRFLRSTIGWDWIE
jgi:hypothetical protein